MNKVISRRSFLQTTGTLALGTTALAFTDHPSVDPGKASQAIHEAEASSPLYCFDFGTVEEHGMPGFQHVSNVYSSPRYLWVTPVMEEGRPQGGDPLLRNFVTGPRGEFWVGLDEGDYWLTMIMADQQKGYGPFAIFIQDQEVESGLQVMAGKILRLGFPAHVRAGDKLRLRFESAPGKNFLLNGLIIAGMPGKAAHRIFKDAPSDRLPTVEESFRVGEVDVRSMLRRYCEWLVSKRLSNGFIGDRGNYGLGSSVKDYWYTAAYPIRTLLAGYHILGDKRYLSVVERLLDSLVAEQLPNGAWQQTFRNKPTADLSKAELGEIERHEWMNTADIGSIATALAVSCHYVREPRKKLYLDSARRYCDDWASRWRLRSGAFTNGMESGVPQTTPYSVATGTEAAAFAAFYAVTGEDKYLQIAQEAAEFLLDHWGSAGPPEVFTDRGQKVREPINQFGDGFYYQDGILLVYHQTKDPQFRAKVKRVYGWYVDGAEGLLHSLGSQSWFSLQDGWNNSKSAGMPLVFLAYREMNDHPAIGRAIGLMKRFLCTPEFAQRIGVMVNDPNLPWGGHSLQSWAGFAVATTGFAGLSVAEMISPGAIYLSSH